MFMSCSLYKSVTNQDTIDQSTDDAINAYETELKSVQLKLEGVEKENGRMVSQLKTASIEKRQLQQALESAMQEKEW